MRILAFDPGPETCGAIQYKDGQVELSENKASVELALWLASTVKADVVAIERVQSTGQSGASLLRTSEVVGMLWLAAERNPDVGRVELRYRRDVCSELHVHGAGKDKQVRQRMIELHGGSKDAAVGRKATPGPLYGVAGHAWQALGLAVAVRDQLQRA